LFPNTEKIQNTTIAYLPRFRKRSYFVYYTVLFIVVSGLVALPLVYCNIAISVQGITRPVTERTDVKSFIGGIIDTIYYHEGSSIKKGSTILRIKDRVTKGKRIYNDFEINQHRAFIQDLRLLTSGEPNEALLNHLTSPLYKEQLSHYLHLRTDQSANLSKATKELNTNTTLYNQKVITRKEFFDTQNTYDKTDANYKAFTVEQQTSWQQDLIKYGLELSQYKNEQDQVNTDASYYEVKAPVSGTLQDINNRYTGGLLQQNEAICSISPGGNLIGECYVSPKDIGLIKIGQTVHFQIDAFDYNYFGVLTGKALSIDNDFTVMNNTTVFKVRCVFDNTQLHLKNGYSAHLQKGLTFQARFIIGERTLWQLLWDKLDDWLNPSAPKKVA
jgi:multidrug resistance efflux pump